MVFICTALYMEAEPFIEKLKLKKDTKITKFQVFKNSSTTLLITGKGKLKASIALTYLFSRYNCNAGDLIVNIGLCGTNNKNHKIGQVFLCNKIIDNDSQKTYFTDILYQHNFLESSLETFSYEVDSNTSIKGDLIDMEATGIYESTLTFYQPHQLFFIKILSDYLNTNNLNSNFLKSILEKSSTEIISWLNKLQISVTNDNNSLSPKEIQLIDEISNNLKLSSTMKNEFRQVVKYNDLLHGDFSKELENMLSIKCSSKKEGKIYLEKFKEKFV